VREKRKKIARTAPQSAYIRFMPEEWTLIQDVLARRMEEWRKDPRNTPKPSLTSFVAVAAVEAAKRALGHPVEVHA
jgi:hypothetical protein